jgi:tetratricopeptide (TPR) repeat protein
VRIEFQGQADENVEREAWAQPRPMAPRPTTRRVRYTSSPSSPGEALPSSAPPAVVAPSTRLWIGLYVGIFLIAQLVLFLAFQTAGGDSRIRRELLQRAEAAAEAGRHQEHLDVLLDYGKRWPGAYETGDFQQRLGDAHAALGRAREAAEHYMTSASLRPDEPRVHALAGEQWLAAGEPDLAFNAFVQELRQGDPLHPMAHHRLGLAAAQRGDWVQAMRHHAALPDDWKPLVEWNEWKEKLAGVIGEGES